MSTSEINRWLWMAGWNLKKTIAGVTILGFATVLAGNSEIATYLGMILIPGGAIAGFAGLIHVNRNYKSVLDAFDRAVGMKAESLLDFDENENLNHYTLNYGSGKKILRRPNIKYTSTTLVVSDYSLIVLDGNTLRMPSLDSNFSESTTEVYYDQISSVEYDEDEKELRIQRVDGESTSWPSERKPDGVVSDIQKRVRDYKREQVA